jgi:flagellin-specific chaperone FliS
VSLKIKILSLLALCFAATTFVAVANPAESAEEMYVQMYSKCQIAEKAVRARDFTEASTAYQQASEMLTALQRQYPNWRPDVLEYRKGQITAALKELKSVEDPSKRDLQKQRVGSRE